MKTYKKVPKNPQTGRGYFNEGFRSAFGNGGCGGVLSRPSEFSGLTACFLLFCERKIKILLQIADDNANLSLINATEADGSLEIDEANLYEVPTFVVVILSLFYGIISLTAFVGNSLVIYVVVVSR